MTTETATWQRVLRGIERRYAKGQINAGDLTWTIQHEMDWSLSRSMYYANKIAIRVACGTDEPLQ